MNRPRLLLGAGIGVFVLAGVLAVSLFIRQQLIADGWIDVRWTPDRIDRSIAIGDDIVKALEAHRAANGDYPIELIDLVPDHLQEIEPPVAGLSRWSYHTDPNGYTLTFEANGAGYPCCSYSSTEGEWYLDQ